MMKRRMRTLCLIALLGIALFLGGRLLYRHFVTNQIADWGGMENPDALHLEEPQSADEESESTMK